MANLIDLLKEEKLYPIIRCADPQKTKDTARALIDGGVKILEITLENRGIYGAIEDLSKEVTICAGGVLLHNKQQTLFNMVQKLFLHQFSK